MYTLDVLYGGMFDSNAYILCSNGEAVLIDAGVSANEIEDVLKSRGATLKYIIPTHGHIDHIIYIDDIKKKTGAKVLMGRLESRCLSDCSFNLSELMGTYETFEQADGLLDEGDIVEFGDEKIEIINTPGHSAGGICLKIGDVLFSGDTIFRGSVGRTDFKDSSTSDLVRNIKEKILVLDDNTTIYPGHGEATTVAYEKFNNPFII